MPKGKKKSILIISLMKESPWGGSEELWNKIANEALESNYNLFILLKDWGIDNPKQVIDLQTKGASIFYFLFDNKKSTFLKIISKFKNKLYVNWHFKKHVDLLDRINSDVLLVNFGGAYDIISHRWLLDYLINSTKPYFIIQQFNTEYSCLPYIYSPIVKSFFEKAKKAYFVSLRGLETTKRNLVSKLPNAVVVSNPLKSELPLYTPYPIQPTMNFACVARLSCNIKCQDMLLEAFSKSEWRNRSWHLNFYGNGVDLEFLIELTKFYDITESVTFHKHINDVKQIWSANNIMVLPSIAEGTPLSLIEAMFSARTAIVTDVGGNSELIDDNLNGFIIKGSSVVSISNAINLAWAKKHEWEEMGMRAMKKVQDRINRNSANDILKDLGKCM